MWILTETHEPPEFVEVPSLALESIGIQHLPDFGAMQ